MDAGFLVLLLLSLATLYGALRSPSDATLSARLGLSPGLAPSATSARERTCRARAPTGRFEADRIFGNPEALEAADPAEGSLSLARGGAAQGEHAEAEDVTLE